MSDGAPPPSFTPPAEAQHHFNLTVQRDMVLRALENRSVFLPERRHARRIGAEGRLGSQKAVRIQFSTAVCEAAGVTISHHYPISRSKSRQICSRLRGILRNTFGVQRGARTCTELKDLCDMQQARRLLEKHFPTLALAENQWAADGCIQETARTDRIRANE